MNLPTVFRAKYLLKTSSGACGGCLKIKDEDEFETWKYVDEKELL